MAQQYPNNLWEVISFDDLLYFLRKSKDSHIMLGMVLKSTDDDIKSMIRTFLKHKSRIFPNVTFLYFVAKNCDLGKLGGLIDKDVSNYPYMFNIYNIRDILIKISNIESMEDLEKGFAEIEPDYQLHKKHFLQHFLSENNDESDNEIGSHELSGPDAGNNAEQFKEQMKKQMELQAEKQQQSLSDKKRLLDKILLLKASSEQYQLEFVQDIVKRKKDEEKADGSKKKKH
jgi:hypothetical protein